MFFVFHVQSICVRFDDFRKLWVGYLFTPQNVRADFPPNPGTTTYPRRANSSGAAGATSSADLVCKICVRKFTSHAALKRHIESKHTQNLVTFSCEVCNKPFKTKWSLSTHTSRFHRRSALEEVLIVDNEQEYNDDNADDGVVVMKSSPTGSPKQTPEKQLASMGRANVEIAS